MSIVTYLFGAGASFNTVPLVEQIPDKIKELINLLTDSEYLLDNYDHFPSLSHVRKDTPYNFQMEMIEDLKWMLNESSRHSSIDTFAKKLYIRKDWANLKKLKLCMSVFFTCIQCGRRPDKRYDSFLASIFDEEVRIPKNIRMVSWNYDFQLELAIAEYTGDKRLESARSILGIRNKNELDSIHIGANGLFKLNGSAYIGSEKARSTFPFGLIYNKLDRNQVASIVEMYAKANFDKTMYSLLSFAWEREFPGAFKVIENTPNYVKETKDLVVIGYSFPFFNRKIDSMMLTSMQNLGRIYIQNPKAEAITERIKTILPSFHEDNIIIRRDTESFYLPDSL